jgi:glycosyltransferase involved in cell wall biosynthesis
MQDKSAHLSTGTLPDVVGVCPRKVLLVHNRYQLTGGEDEVYSREKALLLNQGHEVVEYIRDNAEIAKYGARQKAALIVRTTWAWDSYRELVGLLQREKPEVAHFHNTFPLISPAAYYACSSANIPVVQTLHNPRLLCPAATLFRDGSICEECVGRSFALPAVRHGCYQHSRSRSAVVASMLSTHQWLGTWRYKVNTYIASTEFYRRKFAETDIPPEKIVVKSHFVDADPGCTQLAGEYAVFVGRLAPEKGVPTLLAAWKKLGSVPLRIRGEGPLGDVVSLFVNRSEGSTTLVPRLTRSGLFDLIKGARFLVWPSEGYYETFGLIAIEAFACGVPVIASRCGVMQEIVDEGRTGLHFTTGSAHDLAEKVGWAWSHPGEMRDMGRTARAEYEAKYTADRNYKILLNVYHQAIQEARKPLPSDFRKVFRVAD